MMRIYMIEIHIYALWIGGGLSYNIVESKLVCVASWTCLVAIGLIGAKSNKI